MPVQQEPEVDVVQQPVELSQTRAIDQSDTSGILLPAANLALLLAALTESFSAFLSGAGVFLRSLGGASADEYLPSRLRLLLLAVATGAGVWWTFFIFSIRPAAGLSTATLWLAPWSRGGRALWRHLFFDMGRWASLSPVLPTGLLLIGTSWACWGTFVVVSQARPSPWGLAGEMLLSSGAAAIFFLLRRALIRFHAERDVDHFVLETPSASPQRQALLAAPLLFVGSLASVGFALQLRPSIEGSQPRAPPPSEASVAPPARTAPIPTPVAAATQPVAPPPAPGESIAELRRGVVLVKRTRLGGRSSVGSGFIVSSDGLLFTNRHVVDGPGEETRFEVGLANPEKPEQLEFRPAERLYVSPPESVLDFAALRIDPASVSWKLHALELNPQRPALGEPVTVLGFPPATATQVALSVTRGNVSAEKVTMEGLDLIRTDAAINPGNSGGPMLDGRGMVVGIVTSKRLDAELMGFAIPVGAVTDLRVEFEGLMKHELHLQAPLPPTRGFGNWSMNQGINGPPGTREVTLHLNGAPYWMTSSTELPADFQLEVDLLVQFMRGTQQLYATQVNVARSLFLRFATKNTEESIGTTSGYFIQFTDSQLLLFREQQLVERQGLGSPEQWFSFIIRKRGATIVCSVDDVEVLRWVDPSPLPSSERLSIGGFLSHLTVGRIVLTDLTGTSIGVER